MSRPHAVIVDQWSPLSHKQMVGDPGTAVLSTAPTWVPAADRRRLAAYTVRAAYLANVARGTLPGEVPEVERGEHREYGDPAALVDRIVAGVLGSEWTLAVDGADGDLLAGPAVPDRPEPSSTGDQELDGRIDSAAAAAWQQAADEAVAAWEQALVDQPAARARQTELHTWADTAQFPSRVTEAEHDAVGLADSVYILWPQPGDWPAVQVMDPGFYFPQLDDDQASGFPDRVDFGWEYDRPNGLGGTERWIRRITFELADLTAERLVADGRGNVAWAGLDGQPTETLVLPASDRYHDGRVRRTLPWHGPDDEPATTTWVLSDGEWPLADVQAGDVHALDDDRATWRIRRQDLGVDFCPVVHVPNTPSGKEHYGRSVLDQVAQILDDLATLDTRVAGGTAYLGAPAIALSGASLPDGTMLAPGRVYGLGEKGSMTPLDLSAGVDRLMQAGEALVDRLYRNIGVPGDMMGRVDTGAIAGITLLLRFAPFAQLVGVLRQAREPKMRLLLKMVQRLAQVAGVLEPGPTPVARIVYGNFLPTNRAETVELVVKAVQAHVMSTQTAVSMLVAAGIPVEDAQAEVARIRYENPAAASEMADALGNESEAARWLGVDPPAAAAAPPVLDLPPAA